MKFYLISLLLLTFSLMAHAQSDRGLAKLIAKDLAIDEEVAFQVIKSFKHHTVQALLAGKVVRLQGLGQFYVEQGEAKMGNPRTGEVVPIPAKKYLRFKPSKAGNQSLN